MNSNKIFLDGRIVRARSGLIESLTPGIVEGKGVFETMRVYKGKILFLEEHFNRLFRGLKMLRLKPHYSKKQWGQHLYKIIKINPSVEASIRLAVWQERGRSRIAIVCQESRGFSRRKYQKGFSATISDVRREKTRYSNIKSMDYACFRKAYLEALRKGCDEAILLNNRGEIIEGSRTNLFFIKTNVLYTPAVRCGCLNGVTRAVILRCVRQLGMRHRAVPVRVEDLLSADEAFLTNSLLGIMPLTKVDGRLIGSGISGFLTQKLRGIYHTKTHPPTPENYGR